MSSGTKGTIINDNTLSSVMDSKKYQLFYKHCMILNRENIHNIFILCVIIRLFLEQQYPLCDDILVQDLLPFLFSTIRKIRAILFMVYSAKSLWASTRSANRFSARTGSRICWAWVKTLVKLTWAWIALPFDMPQFLLDSLVACHHTIFDSCDLF